MSARKRLSLNFALFLLSEVLNKVFPLAILKVATARLGLASFGFAQFGIGVMEMLIPFVVWGYNNFGTIAVGSEAGDHARQRETVSNVVVLKLVHAVLIAAALNAWVAWSPDYAPYRTLFPTLTFILLFTATELLWVNVASQKLAIVTAFIFAARALSFLAIVVFVRSPADGVALAALTLASNALIGLFTTLHLRQWFSWRSVNVAAMRRIFLASQRFALVIVVFAVLDRLDVVIAEKQFGTAAAGLYMGPLRIVNSLVQMLGAFLLPLFSEFVALRGREAVTRHARLATEVLALAAFPMVVGLAFVRQDVLAWVLGPDFQGAGAILVLQACALIPYCVSQLFGNQILIATGKSRAFNGVLVGGAFLFAALAWFGGTAFGLAGVALGALAGKCLIAAATLALALRRLDKVGWAPLAKPAFATAVMAAGLALGQDWPGYVQIPAGGALYGLALLASYRGHLKTLLKRRTLPA